MDGSGNLYGTTYSGGAFGDGAVFEVAQDSGTITTLVSFNGSNGANPNGGLTMDGRGNLHGTTSFGGASNDGTVFEVTSSQPQSTSRIRRPGGGRKRQTDADPGLINALESLVDHAVDSFPASPCYRSHLGSLTVSVTPDQS